MSSVLFVMMMNIIFLLLLYSSSNYYSYLLISFSYYLRATFHISELSFLSSICCISLCASSHFLSCCKMTLYRGGSRIFFRRGCTHLLLYFNANKPHTHPLHPPPRSAPVIRSKDFEEVNNAKKIVTITITMKTVILLLLLLLLL